MGNPKHCLNDWKILFFSFSLFFQRSRFDGCQFDVDQTHRHENWTTLCSQHMLLYHEIHRCIPFAIKFYNIEPELFVRFFSHGFFFSLSRFGGIFFVLSLSVILYPRIIIAQREDVEKKHAEKRTEYARIHTQLYNSVTLNDNRLCVSAAAAGWI